MKTPISHVDFSLTPYENLIQNQKALGRVASKNKNSIVAGLNDNAMDGSFYTGLSLLDYVHDIYGAEQPPCVIELFVSLFNMALEQMKDLIAELFSIGGVTDLLFNSFGAIEDITEDLISQAYESIDTLITSVIEGDWLDFENIIGNLK